MSPRFDLPTLLADLTLEEKASLVSGQGFWWTRKVERVGLPSIMVSDGPHGLRKQEQSADHVGIGGSVPATCFPPASALGSSWDVDLVRRVGVAIAEEARGQGVGVVLGPGINIKRSPLCAAATSSTSPRTPSWPVCSARPWSRASRAWVSAPR